MFGHADNGRGGGTHAGALDSGGLDDDLNLMIEAEVNEGGPPLPDPSEVAAGKASSVHGAHDVSRELSSSGPCPAPDEVVQRARAFLAAADVAASSVRAGCGSGLAATQTYAIRPEEQGCQSAGAGTERGR